MPKNILVTYASRTGSTGGVAEAIGKILAESGAQVEVRPMQDIVDAQDLAGYGAVVAGSAIRGAKWLPEAMEFVRTYRAELARKPFAVFLVCMTLAMPGAEKYRVGVAEWLEPVRAQVKPVSEGLFPGILDISRVPALGDRLKFRASVLVGVWSEGDHRDWDAVRAWAESLRPLLLR